MLHAPITTQDYDGHHGPCNYRSRRTRLTSSTPGAVVFGMLRHYFSVPSPCGFVSTFLEYATLKRGSGVKHLRLRRSSRMYRLAWRTLRSGRRTTHVEIAL